MIHTSSTTLIQPLTTLLPREKTEQEAQRLGVVVRRRIVDIHALVWTLVLGFQTGSRYIQVNQEKALHILCGAFSLSARTGIADISTLSRS